MADQQEGGATATATPPAQKERLYQIVTEVTLDFSTAASAATAMETIKGFVRDGDPLTVMVRVGRSVALNPKDALKALAGIVDLDGDYNVIADSQINRYKDVKSKTAPTVTIGG